MIKNRYFLISFYLLILITIGHTGKAQKSKFTISGYVHEKGSKELLIGVNVYVPELKVGTVSNNYGFYSLTLLKDSIEIYFSYIGYQLVGKKMFLDKNIELNVGLQPGLQLGEVVITAEKSERISEAPRMSVIDLPIEHVKNIPALLGEKDVLKTIQLMPGVQSGTEGSTGLYIRGGGPDQNLIILDDAIVYNASHLFGFFSVFNGDAIKSIELTKGGFPARYGGRLSSVIDMNMKDGNKEKYSGEAGIGLISSRLIIEGPIIKDKSSFLISGRRTYIDLLMRPFMPDDEVGGYFFYDLNAKANYDFGRKDKLYISAYFGRDKFYIKDNNSWDGSDRKFEAGLYWQNITTTARWNHLFSEKLFSNTSLIFSNYNLKIYMEQEIDGDIFSINYISGIRDYSLKYDLSYYPNPNHLIRTGMIFTYHHFTPGAVAIKDEFLDFNENYETLINTIESGLYIEDEIKIKSRIKVLAGFRMSHFLHENKNYIKPEPRFSASYKLKEDMALKLSFSVMNQYVHLLSNTGIGLPTDLWVPSTDNVAPQKSKQVALGIAKDFLKQNLALSVEGYYKKSDDVIGYREGASFLLIDDPTGAESISWEDNITTGQSWSYGVEFLLQRKIGKLSGWVGYTLSWTQLQFDELNLGEKYWAKYDRRHDISLVGIYKPSDKVTISGTWVYGTGNAISLPRADYRAYYHPMPVDGYTWNSNTVIDYGEKNSFRMRAYHRLDLGVQFHKKIEGFKKMQHTFEISVYNAYNRKNPFFYYSEYDYKKNENVLKQVSIFPIIPSFTYTFKF